MSRCTRTFRAPPAPRSSTWRLAAVAWGLPSEPWLYFVDEEGIVTARYEGTVSPEAEGFSGTLEG